VDPVTVKGDVNQATKDVMSKI
jgi:hypothetical protein